MIVASPLKYGLGYGGRIGLIWLWLQTGLFGFLLYLLLHACIIGRIFKSICVFRGKNAMIWAIGFMGMAIVFALDLFYSSASIRESFLILPYYYLAGVLIKRIEPIDTGTLRKLQ